VTHFCGEGRTVIQPNCFSETDQVLKVTGCLGSRGFSLSGLSPTDQSPTVDSPQIGHSQIGEVLEVKGICGDERAATPIACGPDIGQILKATGLPGSGECPI
jgi:hypothetical protein